jgi:hypothetical protein
MPAATDRMKLTYVEESTFADDSIASQTVQELLVTSESLGQDSDSVVSNLIRDDRQITNVKRTNASASGDIGIELGYGMYDDLIEAALQSSGFSGDDTVTGTTISFAAASGGTQVISDSGSGFGDINIGQWVRVSGAAAANNGIYKVTAAAAGAITVENPSGTSQTAGDSITVAQGEQIVNGVALRTFAFEKTFTDLTNKLAQYFGMAVNTFGLTVRDGELITGSFGFLGKKEQSDTSSFASTTTAAPTPDTMSAVDDVFSIVENNTEHDISEFTLNLNNNLRARTKVGSLGPFGLGSGRIDLTGTLVAYLANETLIDKFLNWTNTALAIKLRDTAGNDYVIDLPNVKFTAGRRVAGGQNQDFMAELSWTAIRDAAEDVMIRIARWDA